MPYKVVGKNLLHKINNRWSIKQKCKSHDAAVRIMGYLNSITHGGKK